MSEGLNEEEKLKEKLKNMNPGIDRVEQILIGIMSDIKSGKIRLTECEQRAILSKKKGEYSKDTGVRIITLYYEVTDHE